MCTIIFYYKNCFMYSTCLHRYYPCFRFSSLISKSNKTVLNASTSFQDSRLNGCILTLHNVFAQSIWYRTLSLHVTTNVSLFCSYITWSSLWWRGTVNKCRHCLTFICRRDFVYEYVRSLVYIKHGSEQLIHNLNMYSIMIPGLLCTVQPACRLCSVVEWSPQLSSS